MTASVKKRYQRLLEKKIALSREQGESLAAEYGNDVDAFLKTLEFWTQENALEIDII